MKTVETVSDAELLEYLSNVGRETLKDEDETRKSVFRKLKMNSSIKSTSCTQSFRRKLFRNEIANVLWPISIRNRVQSKLK